MKTLEEKYKEATERVLGVIKTWDDLYEFFGEGMDRVTASPTPIVVFDVLFSMFAFMVAMKELPEEGDVQVLVRRMLHILFFESKDKLNADIQVLTKEDAVSEEQRSASSSKEISSYLADFYEEEGSTTKRKVTLH